MLRMAIFRPRQRSYYHWRNRPKALSGLVAALAAMAMPGGLMAQTTNQSANSSTFRDCIEQPAGLPIQMAMAPSRDVEPGAGPPSASKAEAILGGQISKLEQMRQAQGTGGAYTTSTAADLSAALNQPAGNPCDPVANFPLQRDGAPSLALPANAILGSVSIAIARTPFDKKWSAVNAKRGIAKVARLLAATGARNSGDPAEQVEAVNRWVNRKIEFGEDRDIYGRADYWAPAIETFQRGVGDCEDFAIAKMELLSALGISRDRMRLVVARDLVRNADHAVLVVTLGERAVMLDNVTDRLLDARLPNDYRPIMSFGQNSKWVHGYAVQPTQPVRMASASPVVPPAALHLADVLTVTAEPEMPSLSLALLSVPSVLPSALL
jgi:predicted transglutaminase-like cysteine proteinase